MFLILEQALRLKKFLAAQQAKKTSTPSGIVPPYEKPTPPKKDGKRGRKSGHPGSGRKKNPQITKTVQHPPLERCPDCGGPVTPCQSEKAKRTRVIEDIPANIEPEVTAHEIPRSYCPHCKKLVEPKVEDALPNARLGNRALALSAHWHYGLGMPSQQIVDLLSGHLNTGVSRGGLFGMWKRLADWLQPWCEQLIDEMLESAVLHADETGWRVNGKTHWLWCFTNQDATFYMIHPSRGDPALFEFFRETFEGVLVSDFGVPPLRFGRVTRTSTRRISIAWRICCVNSRRWMESTCRRIGRNFPRRRSGCLAMHFDCIIGRNTIPRCFNRASTGCTND